MLSSYLISSLCQKICIIKKWLAQILKDTAQLLNNTFKYHYLIIGLEAFKICTYVQFKVELEGHCH